MIIEHSVTLVVLCLLVLLGCAISLLSFGKSLPGKGSWLIWSGILVLLLGIGIDSGILLKEELKVKVWSVGWIWPKTEMGAITIGIFQDALALIMSLMVVAVAGVFLITQVRTSSEPHSERATAAVGISTVGVVLSWISLTPWIALVGQVFTMIGAFVASGAKWDSSGEARVVSKLVWEKSIGILFALFGVCVLAASRSALVMDQAHTWLADGVPSFSTWVGSLLLISGLFIQVQPFPFIGSLVSESQVSPPVRVFLCQLLPAWAVFPFLIRLEGFFGNLGVFPGFGWVALFSTFLIVLSGLFQSQWKLSLSTWISAGLSLACALLALSGPLSAVSILLGVTLASLCMAGVGSILELEYAPASSQPKRIIWLKAIVFIAVFAGTGGIGFISSVGGIRFLLQNTSVAAELALRVFALFSFMLLGWKLAWNIASLKKQAEVGWSSILSFSIWVILALGVVWTGSISGGILVGVSDQVLISVFDQLFKDKNTEAFTQTNLIASYGFYWGAWIFAVAAAYWTAGRKEDRWQAMRVAFPKATRFVANGYGVDPLVTRIGLAAKWMGEATQKLIDQKIWGTWVPQALSSVVQGLSLAMNQADLKLVQGLNAGLMKTVEIPAKFLQMIQTGDLRWYLLFALGSGFALLSHFIK